MRKPLVTSTAALALTGLAVVGALRITAGSPEPQPAAEPQVVATPATIDPSQVNRVLGLSASTLIRLDVPDTPEVPISVTLPLEGQVVTLDLAPHSVRAEGYRVLAQLEDGSWMEVPPGPVRTLRGTVREIPGAVVAGSLYPEGLAVQILMPDDSSFWVEPLALNADKIEGVTRSDYVVYRGEDVLPSGGSCATSNAAIELPAPQPEPDDVLLTGPWSTELACDADFEYYQFLGSVPNVENRVNQILNLTNIQYRNQTNITHRIVVILVRTSEPDPYSSTDPVTLLNQFRSEWLINQGHIQRDVAHLFTGKNLDGSVIGIAYTIGGICTSSGYCLSQAECCGSTSCAADLVAHELGHLWGAFHCCPGTTMNPTLTCALFFAQQSINEIVAHRQSRPPGCLDKGAPPPGPGPFNLLQPPNNATGVSTGPLFDWSDSQGAIYYQISAADNPNFTNPLFTFSVGESQYQAGPGTFQTNRQYWWRVAAFNSGGGRTWGDPNPSTFTTGGGGGCPGCNTPGRCRGDTDGDGDVDQQDLGTLLAAYGRTRPDPLYNACADFDCNNTIDQGDLGELLARYGQNCP